MRYLLYVCLLYCVGIQTSFAYETCAKNVIVKAWWFDVAKVDWELDDCQKPWGGQAKRLTFNYLRDVPKKAFIESSQFWLKENKGNVITNNSSTLNDKIIQQLLPLIKSYQDIKVGEVYQLDFLPKRGLQLKKNNQVISEITDSELAEHYFAIWLGKKPFNPNLKKQLVNK